MRPSYAALLALAIAHLPLAGSAQTALPDRTRILMKLGATYRACQSIRAEGTWTRRVGDKEVVASVALAALRPNRFRLEIQGPDIGTDVACDGRTLIALRTQRKAYIRSNAPEQLIGADILRGVDLPAPGVELTALLLQGMWRDARHPLAKRLAEAEITGPVPFGSAQAYVIKFDYSTDYTARVYITSDDYVLRRATLYANDRPVITEVFTRVEFDKPLSPDGFAMQLPEGARLVSKLPPVVLPAAPVPITVRTIDGRTIAFDELRGKVVLVTFFFTTCPYCNDEMPHLEELSKRFGGSLEVIALNGTGETPETLKQWAAQQGVTFPVAMNKTSTDLVAMFKVKAYPTNVIFDREGRVVYKKEGLDLDGLLKALAEVGFGR